MILITTSTIPAAKAQTSTDPKLDAAIRRAIDYLSVEVRDWSRNNGCFSCHNNGVGVVALLAARERGYEVPDAALAETLDWLRNPQNWDSNQGNSAASDKKLARIHFFWARELAIDVGEIDSDPMENEIRGILAADRSDSGAWIVDPGQSIGSPVTLGDTLATYMAITLVLKWPGDQPEDRKSLEWLTLSEPNNTLDRGVKLFCVLFKQGLEQVVSEVTEVTGAKTDNGGEISSLLGSLLNSQNGDGGWGPYPGGPSEVFDTSLALWGVVYASQSTYCDGLDCAAAIRRGSKYLVDAQLPAGGWPGTTRPSGGPSYAQHIATTGWALQTLLILDELQNDSN